MEEFEADIDESGRLILPPELVRQFGLNPGTRVHIGKNSNAVHLRRPLTHIAKIYIEVTNRCNLDCVTCIRQSWEEPLGEMSYVTFDRILASLRSISPPPDVFFGGLGEPLSHPYITDMVAQIKYLGSSVEMITNGTLLNKTLSQKLIDAGLDKLWVSLDGATPESYKDIRLGAALPEVLNNLAEFRHVRWSKHRPIHFDLLLKPQLGIVFVAMKRNIADLPSVFSLANRLGALEFLVTNALAYTPEIQDEILYAHAINDAVYTSAPLLRYLNFPKMDINPATREAIYQAMRGDHSLSIAGGSLGESNNRCPFVEKGALAIRWDGVVSPCLELLHDHRVFFHRYERSIKHHTVGNVLDRSIKDIWNAPDHLSLRKRLREFNFSPCILCGGCDYFESNQEDCIGSQAPACGGCLWAQGIIQCP
jgi:MoaA/NifB/PqqE/SkfB family radical SAM enzyme